MNTTIRSVVLGLAALLTACAKPAAQNAATAVVAQARDSITGTVAYRERLALPADAVLRLQLQDVSKPGAAATVVATATAMTQGRQVPLAFSLPYDTLHIDPTNTYAVQASIEVGGQLLFANEAAYPVITRGNPKRLQMTLHRAAE
jgi:putative lipoprotein